MYNLRFHGNNCAKESRGGMHYWIQKLKQVLIYVSCVGEEKRKELRFIVDLFVVIVKKRLFIQM